MKIPSKIRIGGVDYTVIQVDHLEKGNVLAYGHIDFEDCTITLNGTICKNEQKMGLVLWHEILHGIREHIGVSLPEESEEDIIDMFARGVYMVLQDNGRRLFDIIGQDEERKRAEEAIKKEIDEMDSSGCEGRAPEEHMRYRSGDTVYLRKDASVLKKLYEEELAALFSFELKVTIRDVKDGHYTLIGWDDCLPITDDMIDHERSSKPQEVPWE